QAGRDGARSLDLPHHRRGQRRPDLGGAAPRRRHRVQFYPAKGANGAWVMSDKKLVHVVDDEDSIRRSVGFMLKTSGYLVETWSSGQAFLKEVKHAEEGCVLLDVRMP